MSGIIGSLFGGAKKRTPEQVVAQLRKDLTDLAVAEAASAAAGATGRSEAEEKINADIRKQVDAVKAFVYGEEVEDASAAASGSGASAPARPDPAGVDAIARAMMGEEIMPLAVGALKAVDFETRKDFVALFCFLVRGDVAGFASAYLPRHSALLYQVMDGYASTEIALSCGSMLREVIRNPRLHKVLLYGPDGGLSKPLCDLFEYHVNNPNFEVASDAFETLTAVLMSNKGLVFECLNPNGDAASLARYGELFAMFNRLLQSENYVLKRQSLKLLSELLLDRDNFAIMMRYIVDKANLRIIMTLLRHNQPNVQFEAFHVFKVFVANPEKPADIAEILAVNKARLIPFLRNFQNEKSDEQFMEEKAMLIDTLARLPDVDISHLAAAAAAATPAAAAGSAASASAAPAAPTAGGAGSDGR